MKKNSKDKERIKRYADIDFSRAIDYYEQGEISKENLKELAHDYCLNLPLNSVDFRRKIEVALRAEVISIQEHADRLREFYLSNVYSGSELGYEGIGLEGIIDDTGYLLMVNAKVGWVESHYQNDEFQEIEWTYKDYLNYSHKTKNNNLEWKTRALYLAAKAAGFFDFQPVEPEGDDIYFTEDGAYLFLEKVKNLGFSLPDYFEKGLKWRNHGEPEGQEPDYADTFYSFERAIRIYYFGFFNWLSDNDSELHSKYIGWVKKHKKNLSKKIEEANQRERELDEKYSEGGRYVGD